MTKQKKITANFNKAVKINENNTLLKKKKLIREEKMNKLSKKEKNKMKKIFALASTDDDVGRNVANDLPLKNSKKFQKAIINLSKVPKKLGRTNDSELVPKKKTKTKPMNVENKNTGVNEKLLQKRSSYDNLLLKTSKKKLVVGSNEQLCPTNKKDLLKNKTKQNSKVIKKKKLLTKVKTIKKGLSKFDGLCDEEVFENNDDDDDDPELEMDVMNFIKELNIEKFKSCSKESKKSELNVNSHLPNNAIGIDVKAKFNLNSASVKKEEGEMKKRKLGKIDSNALSTEEKSKRIKNLDIKVGASNKETTAVKVNIAKENKKKESLGNKVNSNNESEKKKTKIITATKAEGSNTINEKKNALGNNINNSHKLRSEKSVDKGENHANEIKQINKVQDKNLTILDNSNAQNYKKKKVNNGAKEEKTNSCNVINRKDNQKNINSCNVTKQKEKDVNIPSELFNSKEAKNVLLTKSKINLQSNKFNINQLKHVLNSNGEATTNISNKSNTMEVVGKPEINIADKDHQKDSNTNSPKKPPSTREKLVAQLQSASFRIINEKLYLSNGSEGYNMFKSDPEAFKVYHQGYNTQVSQWPTNPLSIVIKWLRKKPRNWIVADFGCGEAVLSSSVPQKVFSLDLIASTRKVIECDMANTPLKSNSVNVAVFCLSLMGTNISDFILEANRVLVDKGVLKIAEVESRLENLDEFLKLMFKLGFKCIHKNQKQKYFWLFDFIKIKSVSKKATTPEIALKPCYYKKR